ncbi:MAG TPA: RpiB/LacA/LacB family sugar-phosphate isomerase [Candidatus Paceibacterota bacterium]|jgi:ribose 5-phosphate isomerase B|nr:RpiB/LacA/LacB family sugar-phosphate isomerase [Candidatus Paceibacterota bacterium]
MSEFTPRPRLYFASDHAGFALKQALMEYASTLGCAVEDLGPFALDPADDYPDFVTPLAQKVATEHDARGVVIGGDGEGEAMCANRTKGVRAGVFYGGVRAFAPIDAEGAAGMDGFDLVRLMRRHNDANVLALGARFVSGEEAREAVRIFLETPFSGAERHIRRIAKF